MNTQLTLLKKPSNSEYDCFEVVMELAEERLRQITEEVACKIPNSEFNEKDVKYLQLCLEKYQRYVEKELF